MSAQAITNTVLTCSFGAAPSALQVLPANCVLAGGAPAANIMDHIPLVNIQPFGLCSSLANPTVASATAAALGVLTPMPCVPATVTPWTPGVPTVLVGSAPALDCSSLLMCMWAGVITVAVPGQFTVLEP
jgi:hypothetical protein